MTKDSRMNWAEFDAITPEQADANALADPDAPPEAGPEVIMAMEDGRTVLERFRKALAREREATINCDPDILAWFKNRGTDYQEQINSVLRSFMEAEKAPNLKVIRRGNE